MKKALFSLLLAAAWSAAFAANPTASAPATNAPAPTAIGRSGSWLEDSVIHPKTPFATVEGTDPNGWNFVIEPYVWATGLYGQMGFKNLPPGDVNMTPVDVLKKLDWGFFARAEVRKGRWGILADGFYAKFSATADPGAGLYRDLSISSEQSMVSLAAAFRVISDRSYFVDVYAGGRFNYLGASVSGEIDPAGIDAVSETIVDSAVKRFSSYFLKKYPSLKHVSTDTAQLAREEAVRELSRRITEKLPTSVTQDRMWLDPIVGGRAQVNITRWLFAAAQADVGGFGAGSQVTWNTQATLGVNFTRNIALEAGYRYMYVDYDKDNFLYKVNMPGVFAGLQFKF